MSQPCPDTLRRATLTRALRSLLVVALALVATMTLARAECGDSIVDGTEQCDGTDLGGSTCVELGFPGGILKCNGDCTFNTSECQHCPEDIDGDGFQTAACGGPDCNDHDPAINPDATDICDGQDNDCDPASADGAEDPLVAVACDGPDLDLCPEGTTSCTGGAIVCSDTLLDNPDICDGLDNDCDPASPDGSEDTTTGAPCDGADTDLCNEGFRICAAGAIVCSDTTSSIMDFCNGFDDDCDPASADGSEDASTGVACDGADSDLCPEGAYFCTAGILNCSDGSGSTLDVCNGLDDDCDSVSPDGSEDPATGAPCDGPDTDLCVEGTRVCTAGVIACSDSTGSTVDLCNSFDDDCDPASSDGSEDPLTGALCDGLDSDLCREGTNVCAFGFLSCSDNSGSNLDVCNGFDDDCDPASPDGSEDPATGAPCDGPDTDLCAEGTRICTAGVMGCSDSSGSTQDVCNGFNDDCDPASADGSEDPLTGTFCDGPDSDLCNEGTRSCTAGLMVCSDTSGSTSEVCDGADNDCNGTVDEGCGSCGNGLAEPGEECDAGDLNGMNCVALGFTGGVLSCSPTCSFDTSGCTSAICGNNVKESGEQCDGSDLNGANCVLFGYPGGTLSCRPTCSFDFSGCSGCLDADGDGFPRESCGGTDCDDSNAQINPGAQETCNGMDDDCDAMVDEGCSVCGNGVIEPGEQCDDANTVSGDGCSATCKIESTCTGGLINCGGVCVDVSVDTNHCGACGVRCATGDSCLNGVCSGSSCTDGMQNGQETDVDCGGPVCPACCSGGLIECNGTCVDVSADPNHCGACGVHCATGASCLNGLCTGSCVDGMQNGDETDVDCGGSVCPACPAEVCALSGIGDPGLRVTLPITLEGGVGVAGFQVDIGFNPTLLTPVGVTLGPDPAGVGGWFINNAIVGPGRLRILADSNPPTGLTAGPLVRIALVEFEIASFAPFGPMSPLALDNCVISDAQGVQIDCTICGNPGQVTVRSAASFRFRPIDSPVGVDRFDPLPFPAAVDPLTAGGLPAGDYNGTAAMSVGPVCNGALRPDSLSFAFGFGTGMFEIACCLDSLLPRTSTPLNLQAFDSSFGISGDSGPITGFAKADVNADDAVNVLDVVPAIYLTLDVPVGGPPPVPPVPFQRWAANMLDQHCAVDGFINVLDVVRIRNKALSRPALCPCTGLGLNELGGQASALASPPAPFAIRLEKDGPKDFLLKVQGAVDLSGLQIEVKAAGPKSKVSLEGLTAGRNWQASTTLDQGVLRVVAFSNAATGISGDGVVLRFTGGGNPRITRVVASDTEGREIPVK